MRHIFLQKVLRQLPRRNIYSLKFTTIYVFSFFFLKIVFMWSSGTIGSLRLPLRVSFASYKTYYVSLLIYCGTILSHIMCYVNIGALHDLTTAEVRPCLLEGQTVLDQTISLWKVCTQSLENKSTCYDINIKHLEIIFKWIIYKCIYLLI